MSSVSAHKTISVTLTTEQAQLIANTCIAESLNYETNSDNWEALVNLAIIFELAVSAIPKEDSEFPIIPETTEITKDDNLLSAEELMVKYNWVKFTQLIKHPNGASWGVVIRKRAIEGFACHFVNLSNIPTNGKLSYVDGFYSSDLEKVYEVFNQRVNKFS